jgi:hypothetical protein
MVGMMRDFERDGLRVAPGRCEWASVGEVLTNIRRLPGRRFGEKNGARWVSEGEHDDMAMALAPALLGTREVVLPERGDRVRRAVGR